METPWSSMGCVKPGREEGVRSLSEGLQNQSDGGTGGKTFVPKNPPRAQLSQPPAALLLPQHHLLPPFLALNFGVPETLGPSMTMSARTTNFLTELSGMCQG